MNVLLTNDDGINSPGLRALFFALRKAGHQVCVAAPMRQQSGSGQSLTVFEPLRGKKIVDGEFSGNGIYGTPTDCVKLALGELAPFKPDLVMSGINQGQNTGPDIFYSGTVAAAAEACYAGLSSMAISHASHQGCEEWAKIAAHAVDLAQKIEWQKIPPQRVINVNYPLAPLDQCAGIKLCPQSPAVWQNKYSTRVDPRGDAYWWLVGDIDMYALGPDSDRALLGKGFITVTPLKFEHTDHDCLELLQGMDL